MHFMPMIETFLIACKGFVHAIVVGNFARLTQLALGGRGMDAGTSRVNQDWDLTERLVHAVGTENIGMRCLRAGVRSAMRIAAQAQLCPRPWFASTLPSPAQPPSA